MAAAAAILRRRAGPMALVLVAAGLAAAAPAGAAHAPLGQSGSWKRVFGDEFDGRRLDPGRWYANRWFAARCSRGATAGELAHYTGRRANVAVAGGALRLVARRERYGCGEAGWAGTSDYTSGWVQTGGARASDGSAVAPGFTIGTGYVEARVRLPAGKGLWPAIWLLSTHVGEDGRRRYPSRPEIDILELLGDSPRVWRHNVHLAGVDAGENVLGPSAAAGWHTIGVHRERDRITWYLDGRRTWTYAGPGVPGPSVRMYVVVNLAVGGDWPGAPSAATQLPATMLVDYVRAWTPHRRGGPSVRILRPGRRVRARRPVTVHARATGVRRVSRMELRIAGRLVRRARSGSLRYRWHPRRGRRYVLAVTAYDTAGNRSRRSRRITVHR